MVKITCRFLQLTDLLMIFTTLQYKMLMYFQYDSEGTTPSFARDGRSQVIRNVKSVNLKATDRTGLTNPIVQAVVFVTSRNGADNKRNY